jgi:hypothetical protein
MEHFHIVDYDDPRDATETVEKRDGYPLTSALNGHADCIQMGGFKLWVEDNPPETITVHVAVAKRVAIAELEDDQEFTINVQGVYA